MVTRVGLGKIAITEKPICFSQDSHALVDKAHLLFPDFFLYYLSQAVQKFKYQHRGTTIAGVTRKQLSDLPIPLPPLNEQCRIVSKIEELTAHSKRAREALEEVPKLIDQFRQSVLAAAFRGDLTAKWREQNPDVEPATTLIERAKIEIQGKSRKVKENLSIPCKIPNYWTWVTLAEVCRIITDGDHQAIPKTETGVPVIDIRNISSGKLSFNNARYASCEYYESVPAYKRPEKNDILYSVVGTYGIAVVVDTNSRFCLQRNTSLLKPCKVINVNFLAYALQSFLVKIQADKVASGTTQKLITLSNLSRIKVPIAPLTEQEHIVEKIGNILSAFQNIETTQVDAVAELESLNQSILAKAFRGGLVPQDPNDEPASVLLERIRAEREKLGQSNKKGRSRRQKTTSQLSIEEL